MICRNILGFHECYTTPEMFHFSGYKFFYNHKKRSDVRQLAKQTRLQINGKVLSFGHYYCRLIVCFLKTTAYLNYNKGNICGDSEMENMKLKIEIGFNNS